MNRSHIGRKIFSVLMAGMFVAVLVLNNMGGLYEKAVNIDAVNIPNVDSTIAGVHDPIVVNSDTTIELSGVTIEGTSGDPTPIIVENGVTLNLVFSGNNTLTAVSNIASAGIYVKNGATINIYGRTGATLTITGGKYSAGIGGVGFQNHQAVPYQVCGVINIYSGTIVSRGGDSAAGIGSGRCVGGNEINIYGGDVTAIGGTSAAGIGSGYGTSGGGTGLEVGNFTAGTINITGGRVRASCGNLDFDAIDINDPDSFSFNNGFGAGIGGGYGATSGTIYIGGDADVLAVGQCGGAGIGSGRGTDKLNHYNSTCEPCDITIGGDARIIALSGYDVRPTQNYNAGGAAIGAGRGFGISGQSSGSIIIRDNADVFANAGSYADGIGGSYTVHTIQPDDTERLNVNVSIGAQCVIREYRAGQLLRSQNLSASGSGTTSEVTDIAIPVNYMKEVEDKIEAAISLDGPQTVYIEGYPSLSYDVMELLRKNPDITLISTFEYKGVEFKITIPGSCVTTDPIIRWYGPKYLYPNYYMYGSDTAPSCEVYLRNFS